jgi:hypothetical protein
MGEQQKGLHQGKPIPPSGECTVCHRIVTSASWCVACQRFLCWRCEGQHAAIAAGVPGHLRMNGSAKDGKNTY